MGIVIEPVSALGARRCRQKSDALIIPDRFDIDASASGQVTDRNALGSRLCIGVFHAKVLEPVVARGIIVARCQGQSNRRTPSETLTVRTLTWASWPRLHRW